MTPAHSWDPFALLLIDVQRDFWTEEMAVDFPNFPANVARLLATCRHESIEVIHLQAKFQADKSDWLPRYKLGSWIPCIDGTPGAEVLACARAAADEKIFCKQTFDGFLTPGLADYLQARGKRYLFVAGLESSVCVLLTGMAALQRGFLVSLVTDCAADNRAAHQHAVDNYPFAFDLTDSKSLVENYDQWQEQLRILAAS